MEGENAVAAADSKPTEVAPVVPPLLSQPVEEKKSEAKKNGHSSEAEILEAVHEVDDNTPRKKRSKKVKVLKAKAKVEKKAKPSSGQSGAALSLALADLNKNELKLMEHLKKNDQTIKALADKCFPSKTKVQANSWARNALRRPVRAGLIKKVERGTYKLTAKGTNLLKK
jgi:hypothetical protein